LALYWEPKWVRRKVVIDGMEIITCQDLVTKMLLCPICNNVDTICPEGKETNIVSEDLITFFTLEDLIHHMRTHGLQTFKKRISIKERGEEGK